MSFGDMQKETLIKNLHETFTKRKAIYQPNIDTFTTLDGYTQIQIENEKETVEKLEKKWSEHTSDYIEENKMLADIFEGIMVEQLSGSWLGGKGQAYYSSKADDYLRHVDCIVEFNPEEKKSDHHYLGLGIDVTFSEDYSNVLSKMDTIWNNDIQRGAQTEVQYVETENYTGKLPMHRVVLLGDKKTVLELAQLYKDKKMNALNTHPFLVSMIGQIKIQLESYYAFTRDRKLKGEALEKTTDTLRTFYKVYSIHQAFYEKKEEVLQADPQFNLIREYCENKLKTEIH